MNCPCTDRDLLALEPGVFTAGGPASQTLIVGSAGRLSGTTFTASADFSVAQIAPGMVLCTYISCPTEANAWEIIALGGAGALTVSVLRAEPDAPNIAPPAQANLGFAICTYGPQIALAWRDLLDRLGRADENDACPWTPADIRQMRLAVATGALAAVFATRAVGGARTDANWAKADYYRARHQEALGALRLHPDPAADGRSSLMAALSNVRLRRS